MTETRQAKGSPRLLAVAAVATAFPAYMFVRWLWAWRQGHSVFRKAVERFEEGLPFGLHGKSLALACLAAAAVGVLSAGFVLQRAIGAIRLVAWLILAGAAALAAWNLWTMM